MGAKAQEKPKVAPSEGKRCLFGDDFHHKPTVSSSYLHIRTISPTPKGPPKSPDLCLKYNITNSSNKYDVFRLPPVRAATS